MTFTLGARPGATARTVLATYRAAGITAPAWLTDALDLAERVSGNHVAAAADAPSERFVDAVFDAVMAGRSPHDDHDVQTLAVNHLLTTLAYGIDQAFQDRPGAWADRQAVEHADETISAWRKAFNAAAKTLTSGHGDAAHADAVIRSIAAGWTTLYGRHGGHVAADYRLLVFADGDDLAVQAGNHGDLEVTPRGAAAAGLTLSLPATFADYRMRVQNVQAAASRRAEALMRGGHSLTSAQSARLLSDRELMRAAG